MNILIIGNGGREHALAWKVAQSDKVQKIFVAPGNAGTAQETKVENVSISAADIPSLLQFAQQHAIDLTLVGPEAPLVAGIVDQFQHAGLRCFGPTQAAAQLEGSKVFAKNFLARHYIPSASYATFTEVNKALAYLQQVGVPIVIKVDGLAAGKGVIVAHTQAEAAAAVQAMLVDNTFGPAGQQIVIEKFLEGEEVSFICLTDGEHILPLVTSQDHKTRDDHDQGPNTGGMGAYSPAGMVTPDIHARIMAKIIEPTIRGLAATGHPYTGFLYAGLMIDAKGNSKVLEYNCRLGDPETQPLMMRLRSDLVELCLAALEGRLHEVKAEWDSRTAMGVVMVAGGYPGEYTKGAVIHGLEPASQLEGKIFHAGTQLQNGQVITAGGRVLCACALGKTASEAQTKAYALVNQVSWEGMYYRRDIGYRAIAREKK